MGWNIESELVGPRAEVGRILDDVDRRLTDDGRAHMSTDHL